jgi:hypothetical protein
MAEAIVELDAVEDARAVIEAEDVVGQQVAVTVEIIPSRTRSSSKVWRPAR